MLSRRDAAIRLDIPLEMAARHGIPSHIGEAELERLEQDPPAWLVQSRSNRTGAKRVWAHLECAVCGFSEHERPKKWWPAWTLLVCDDHDEVPPPASGTVRHRVHGVGSRFTALVDEPA